MKLYDLPIVDKYYNEFYRYYRMQPHRHPEDEIMYVAQGICRTPCFDTLTESWHDIVLNTGSYIHIRGGILHTLFVERESPCRILNLEYIPSEDRRATMPWTIIQDDGSLLQILSIVHNKLREKDRGLYPDKKNAEEDIGLAVLLLERKLTLQCENPPSSRGYVTKYISMAQDYIREHYAEDLFVADIADHIGITSAYLQRLFRQETGETITTYINGLRLMRSKYLLTHTNLSLHDVAENAGFGSRQRLTQVFRTVEKTSPGKYRAKANDHSHE